MTIFKAVIFDLDGTLVETERLMVAAALASMRSLGLPERPDIFEQLIGTVDQEEQMFAATFGAAFDPVAFNRQWAAEVELAFAKGIALRPGVVALLDMLDAQGLPFALATNSRTQSAHRTLQQAGIHHRFDPLHIHGRDRVARPKPAPDLYLHAARTLGVDPAECIAFEDSIPGVQAALAAGMTLVHVPDQQRVPPDLGAHVQAPTLLDGARALGLIS
jgi:HAD superfamily hydrolase (TIGR01509 family)